MNTPPSASKRTCKVCGIPVKGRADKIFCSSTCKNAYHVNLRKATAEAVLQTDKILHRNRSILLEVMSGNTSQRKVKRTALDKKKFNFNYITGYYVNSRGKTYHHVYDFSWMEFSNQEVLIVKRAQK